MTRPFHTLLIANRGEIACRIIRTAKKMGLRTIAVHSAADAGAPHTRMADFAISIGPAPARDSYLNAEALLAAAAATGAEAVHPGYGFLSENADFAEAVNQAGLVFVGPPPSAIRAMGDKANAKQLMAAGGGPLLPGYNGPAQDDAAFISAAAQTGFPLILKPAAGGGGKGMRIVRTAEHLPENLASARREAAASFGDDRLILERYLEHPRHVEVQIFADNHGNIVHLFERDCTMQRRHQKVIEEAPAPDLPESTRNLLHRSAILAARAVGYTGAGTVEFLLEGNEHPYFMEMNTRLQVEHPVTEAITGLDLVEWQLRIAMGEKLPRTQDQILAGGHAVEVRLYAEDAANGFLPQTGTIAHLRWPAEARVDSGVETGSILTIHYDPLIAKIITHGPDRPTALGRLASALDETEILGPVTNRELLRRLARHPAFTRSPPDVGWLDREVAAIMADAAAPSQTVLAAAAAIWLSTQQIPADNPWQRRDGWRLNLPQDHALLLRDSSGTVHHLRAPFPVCRQEADGSFTCGDLSGRAIVLPDRICLFVGGGQMEFAIVDPLADSARAETHEHHLRAPMPGRVTAVHASDGQMLERGAPIIVLEAMKMEHTLRAPGAGRIVRIRFAVGDQVAGGDELVEWEPQA